MFAVVLITNVLTMTVWEQRPRHTTTCRANASKWQPTASTSMSFANLAYKRGVREIMNKQSVDSWFHSLQIIANICPLIY